MRIFVFSTGLLALTVGGGVGLSMAHQAAFPVLGPMPTVTSPEPEAVAFAVHRTTVPGPAPVSQQAAAVRAPSIVGQEIVGQEPAIVHQAVLRSPTPVLRDEAQVTPEGDDSKAVAVDDSNDVRRTTPDSDRERRPSIIMRSEPTAPVAPAPVQRQAELSRSAPSNDIGNVTLIGVYR